MNGNMKKIMATLLSVAMVTSVPMQYVHAADETLNAQISNGTGITQNSDSVSTPNTNTESTEQAVTNKENADQGSSQLLDNEDSEKKETSKPPTFKDAIESENPMDIYKDGGADFLKGLTDEESYKYMILVRYNLTEKVQKDRQSLNEDIDKYVEISKNWTDRKPECKTEEETKQLEEQLAKWEYGKNPQYSHTAHTDDRKDGRGEGDAKTAQISRHIFIQHTECICGKDHDKSCISNIDYLWIVVEYRK